MTNDILFDPETGLPQLDENHAFQVERTGYYYRNNPGTIEILDNYENPLYHVVLVELHPLKFSERKAIYKENWIFKQFSHWEEPTPLPRTVKSSVYDLTFSSILAKQYDELPEETVPAAVKKFSMYKTACKENGWTEKATIYKLLELNDENIRDAAVRAYTKWLEHQANALKEEIKNQKIKALEDKYTGLYPPKGIKVDE